MLRPSLLPTLCVEGDFDSLSMAELERPVDRSAAGLGIWKRIEFYNGYGINHPTLHGGEIACLKGLQGAPAWPLEWRSEIEPPANSRTVSVPFGGDGLTRIERSLQVGPISYDPLPPLSRSYSLRNE